MEVTPNQEILMFHAFFTQNVRPQQEKNAVSKDGKQIGLYVIRDGKEVLFDSIIQKENGSRTTSETTNGTE